MSNFIPMVSSSPPPMDDGGFDWGDDDDDDDFGTFTGADESGSSFQTTENQSKSIENKISPETVTDPSHHSNLWPTQNGEISMDSENCPSKVINSSSTDIDKSNSINEHVDTRPKNIEIDDSAGDSGTDLPRTDIEDKGPLTDSGLYSADVSPIQQIDQVCYNDKDHNNDMNMSQEYSGSSNDRLEDFDIGSNNNFSSQKVQHDENVNTIVVEKCENGANDSHSNSPEVCDNTKILNSDSCNTSFEGSSQEESKLSVNNIEEPSELSNSKNTKHNSIPTDTSASSIQNGSQRESNELAEEHCDKLSPSSNIDTIECIENRTSHTHDNDLRNNSDVKETQGEVDHSIEMKESVETTEELNQNTAASHSIAGDYETNVKQAAHEQEIEEQIKDDGKSFVTSSSSDLCVENEDTDDWGDFDTSFEITPVNDKVKNISPPEVQSANETSLDIPKQTDKNVDQLHCLGESEVNDSKEVNIENNLFSESTEKPSSFIVKEEDNNLNTLGNFGKFDDTGDSGKDDSNFEEFEATNNRTDKDVDDFGDFSSTCDLNTKDNRETSVKTESIEIEDINEGFSEFHTTSNIPDKSEDEDFGDFNASKEVSHTSDVDANDFGDFNSPNEGQFKSTGNNEKMKDLDGVSDIQDEDKGNLLEDSKRESNIPGVIDDDDDGDDDGFGDFSATNDIPDKNDNDDFGDFNANDDFGDFDEAPGGFAAFGDTESGDQADGPNTSENDWASFSGSQIVESADFVPEDDEEWAAFNDEPGPTPSSQLSSRPIPQNMSPQEKLLFAVTTVFPGIAGDSVTDTAVTDLDNVVQEKAQTQGELSVWLQIRAVRSTNAISYQYTKSHWNNRLFTCLHVDTRNVLIGHKKAPVPVFASGLTMLEPTKGSTAAPLKPEVLVDTSKSSSSTDHPQSQEAIPPAQFDWSSSGLKNPLEADNKTLNLDFLIQDQAVKSNALESEFLGTDSFVTPLKPSMQPLENILANMKSVSTLKPVANSQNISQEALKVVDTLPNLSFMRSKVLMFPLKLDQ